MGVFYEKRCKVCNSKFRNRIEDLNTQGMSPQKVYDYLQGLTDPEEQQIVEDENINPSSIRRHMDRHYDIEDGAKVKMAEIKSKVEKSRENYKHGVQKVIDKVGTITHMIDLALINMEEVEQLNNPRDKHQFTIQYMTKVKDLVESLGKLTGDLKQEGTIDINFFGNEIQRFAEIVLATVREIDKEMGLDYELEYRFGEIFKNKWNDYQTRQQKIIEGELSPADGNADISVNTFNEGV
ncbi:MAG: hypothetical protein ACOCP8_01320 [archaeon]